MVNLFEPEEAVGTWWHRLVGDRSSFPRYPEATVSFEDMAGRIGTLYRALGGDLGVRICAAAATDSGHRLTRLQRLGRSQEALDQPRFENGAIHLPKQIDSFPDPALNRDLFLWLAVFFATAGPEPEVALNDPLQADLAFIARAEAACRDALNRYPGVDSLYRTLRAATLAERPVRRLPEIEQRVEDLVRRRLGDEGLPADAGDAPDPTEVTAPRGYRPFLPVPLWGRILPDSFSPAQPQGDNETLDSPASEPEDGPAKRGKRKRFKRAERDDPLILFRFESILSWAEMLNINRKIEDDDEEQARKALEDQDEINVTRQSRRAATKLRFDLDLPPQAAEEVALEGAQLYPEWDHGLRAYRPDHCRILPELAAEEGENWRADDETRRRIRYVRRTFEALRPKREHLPRQLDGPELDMDALVRSRCELSAFGRGSNRVYQDARNTARDFAVSVLIDLSLSTDSWIDNRRVLDIEKEALTAFAYGLDACGDDFGLFGFTSRKRDRVIYTTIKGFDEPMNTGIAKRIGALRPGYYTRIGTALRHAAKALQERPNRHKLLLLLTDGKPNDLDHYEGRYGVEDTRKAVQEARRMGLAVFAVTVDKEGAAALPYMFGRGTFAAVPRLDKLTLALPRIYRTIAA